MKRGETLKRVSSGQTLFQGLILLLICDPRVLAKLEPWAEIRQRLRRIKTGLKLADGIFKLG
jgi:hypothetical protein